MVLVEVARKAYLASIVPVIVNAILNEHQIVVDIVAFVNKGDFPRSRLGEKQRGKILAGWVSRKMRTMAQFAIKDMDREALGGVPGTSSGDQGGGVADAPSSSDYHRTSLSSFRSASGQGPGHGGGGTSSLRNMEPAPQIIEQRAFEQQQGQHQAMDGNFNLPGMIPPLPLQQQQQQEQPQLGPVEMPADERSLMVDNDQTPTKHYTQPAHYGSGELSHGYELPNFDQFGRDSSEITPGPHTQAQQGGTTGYMSQQAPQIRLPGVDGRESLDDWNMTFRPGSSSGDGNGSGVPGGQGQGAGVGGDDDWTRDAYMSMNLAGTLGGK